MPVVVVTDSASCLPAELCERWAIRQVPLHVLLDGADLRDGVDEIPDDLYERGEATTAAVAPAELCAAYRQALADSDGDGVVAVHISAALSGTVSAAETTAAEFGDAVRVIDSRSAAMGTGFVGLAAARAAATGAGLDTVQQAADAAVQRSHAFVVVHRLTICGAADASAAPRHGWAPRCRSSRCCTWSTGNSFSRNGCAPPARPSLRCWTGWPRWP